MFICSMLRRTCGFDAGRLKQSVHRIQGQLSSGTPHQTQASAQTVLFLCETKVRTFQVRYLRGQLDMFLSTHLVAISVVVENFFHHGPLLTVRA
ncbi:hypothetical protein IWQ54_000914 [Labrenzia sp. EL_195]|nr:hypothetical protein [Labrenzia sp. EL_195]